MFIFISSLLYVIIGYFYLVVVSFLTSITVTSQGCFLPIHRSQYALSIIIHDKFSGLISLINLSNKSLYNHMFSQLLRIHHQMKLYLFKILKLVVLTFQQRRKYNVWRVSHNCFLYHMYFFLFNSIKTSITTSGRPQASKWIISTCFLSKFSYPNGSNVWQRV
jgi:hypothetical protein